MNPFLAHPLRRYWYAWAQLADREGRHLDFGCGRGDFLAELANTTLLECYGVDPHGGYLEELRARWPTLRVSQISTVAELDFPDAYFQSISMLDVLEHVAGERAALGEVGRVLAPGGVLVLSVPARHWFSFLDPDNFKFRMPRFHRLVYTLRFGKALYYSRFVDLSDGLLGDMSVGRSEHTNYLLEDVLELATPMGFRCVDSDGANLFWRWFQVPALLSGPRLRRLLNRLILWDGRLFHSANLFLTLERL